MRRLPLVLAAALVGAAVAPASAAGPIHIKLAPNPSFVVSSACVFSAEYSELRVHGNLLDFVDRGGEFKKTIIAGNFVVRVTNLETTKSLTLNISGQFLMTPTPEGALTIAAHGQNLFYTVDPEPFTVFQRGRAVLTATVSGDMLALVFNELDGQRLDICQALAAI